MIDAILLILFTICFIWVAWWKLDWAIVLCIILLPSYLLRFQLGSLPMTILEVMVLVIFAVWVIKIFSRGVEASATPENKRGLEMFSQGQGTLATQQKKHWSDIFKQVWWPWKWLLIVWVLAGVLAVIISPDTRQALGLWKAYIVEPILFFIVFVNTIKTQNQIRAVVWALGASVVLIGYAALLQYAGLLSIPSPYGLQIPKRATSIFPFPTAVGKFIGPLVALFLGLWLTKTKTAFSSLWDFFRRNIFIGGVLVFGAMALLFSFSRGAIIGVFASLIFISFFSVWKKLIWLILIILVVLCLIMPFTRHELLSVFSVKDTSADVHVVMWKGAVRIIKANPIFGTGLASFPAVYEQYKEASHTEFFPNPDHLILTLWIEMGLAGLVIFTWIIVRFFYTGMRVFRHNHEPRTMNQEPEKGSISSKFVVQSPQLAVALMAALVALIIHGFFDTPYFKNDLAVEFWVLVGLIVVLGKISYNDGEASEPRN